MKFMSYLAAVLVLLLPSLCSAVECDPAKKELKLTIHFDLAVSFDNLFQVVDWCSKELVNEASRGFLPAGDYEFPFCLSPYKTYEILFVDFKNFWGIAPDAGIHDTYMCTWGDNVVIPETVLENDVQVTHRIGTTCEEPEDPWGKGDPHFKTWSGKEFDFHGACDLILLRMPDFHNGEGLHVHARTKLRNEYSYIESAAIRIGEDVFEVTGWGEHAFNGVETTYFPQRMGHTAVLDKVHSTEKMRIFQVNLGDNTTVRLQSFKDMVGVSLDKNIAGNFAGVSGLLGSSGTHDMQARDKSLMDDPLAFGLEWQVRDTDPQLFSNDKNYPQWPDKCVMPNIAAQDERRRLGEQRISREDATKACQEAGRTGDMEPCVFDVIATGDLEMALAGAF